MLTKLFAFRPGTHHTRNEATFEESLINIHSELKASCYLHQLTNDLDRKSLFLEAGTTSQTSCVSLKPADFSRLTINAGFTAPINVF